MKAIITRQYLPKDTIGKMQVIDDNGVVVLNCVTLELPNKNNQVRVSCIPEGTYQVVSLPPNKHFPYKYFHVLNVPGRSEICIHRTNYVSELLGCIALGHQSLDMNGDGVPDINYTKQTMDEFTALVGDRFTLEIKS